jgi:hypothetical protein
MRTVSARKAGAIWSRASTRVRTSCENYAPWGMQRWSMTLCTLLSATAFAAISSIPAAGSAYASELPSRGLLASSAQRTPESEPAALADDDAMLAELPLPPWSSESSTDPPEAGSLLAQPVYGPPATPNAVDEHTWWLVPVAPAEALAFIYAHLPAGTTRPISGGGLEGQTSLKTRPRDSSGRETPARWSCGRCDWRTDQRRCGWTPRSYG